MMIHGFCCWSHFNPSSGPRGFTAVLLVNYLLPWRRRFWGSGVSSEITGVQESEILLIYLPRKSVTSQLFVLKSVDVWSFNTVIKGLPSKAPQRCDHESSGHSATVEILCADARMFQQVSHHCGTPPVWTGLFPWPGGKIYGLFDCECGATETGLESYESETWRFWHLLNIKTCIMAF